MIQALRYCRHYLLLQEFVMFFDHEALRYLGSQKKLDSRHAKWVEFLQEYKFVLKHRVVVENKTADGLSCKISILHSMKTEVTGFDRSKEEYETYPNFGEVYTSLKRDSSRSVTYYTLQDGYISKGVRLCIFCTSMRDFLVWELHAVGMAGHFGRDNTTALVDDRFY